eukprot:5497138-Prymnesium_polylepis.1
MGGCAGDPTFGPPITCAAHPDPQRVTDRLMRSVRTESYLIPPTPTSSSRDETPERISSKGRNTTPVAVPYIRFTQSHNEHGCRIRCMSGHTAFLNAATS